LLPRSAVPTDSQSNPITSLFYSSKRLKSCFIPPSAPFLRLFVFFSPCISFYIIAYISDAKNPERERERYGREIIEARLDGLGELILSRIWTSPLSLSLNLKKSD
jgi:hypothetical protein